MKEWKKQIVAVFFLIICTGIYFLGRHTVKKEATQDTLQATSSSPHTHKKKPVLFDTYIGKPSVKKTPNSKKAIQTAKSIRSKNKVIHCKDTLAYFVEHDVQDLKKQNIMHKDYFPEDCLRPDNYPFAEGILQCQKEPSQTACDEHLQFFRAYAFEKTFPGIDHLGELSIQTLLNKLMWKMMSSDLSSENLQQASIISDQLIDRNPALYAAYKGKFIVEIMQHLFHQSDNKESILTTLENMNEFDAKDPDMNLFDYQLFVDFIDVIKEDDYDPNHFSARIESHLDEFPSSPFGYYLQSWVAWNNGDKENAINAIQTAIKLKGDAPEYIETLDKMKSAQPEQEIFSFSLNFDVTGL